VNLCRIRECGRWQFRDQTIWKVEFYERINQTILDNRIIEHFTRLSRIETGKFEHYFQALSLFSTDVPSNLWNVADLIADETIPNIAIELTVPKIGGGYPRRT
jgi:hypothetical protein